MAALFKNHAPSSATATPASTSGPHHPLGRQPAPHQAPAMPPRSLPANVEQMQALMRQNPEQMAALVRQYQMHQAQQHQLAVRTNVFYVVIICNLLIASVVSILPVMVEYHVYTLIAWYCIQLFYPLQANERNFFLYTKANHP